MFNQQFIKRLMKPSLRKLKMVAFIQRLLTRGKYMFDNYAALKAVWDERHKFNSQTLSLQTYLRQFFNEPTIEVANQQSLTLKTYIYWLFEDQQKTYIYWLNEAQPKYIYWLNEVEDNDYDFCVNCPLSLQGSLDDIKGIVDVMKLAGKRYKVIFA